mgnify:CR=1 FL=1
MRRAITGRVRDHARRNAVDGRDAVRPDHLTRRAAGMNPARPEHAYLVRIHGGEIQVMQDRDHTGAFRRQPPRNFQC